MTLDTNQMDIDPDPINNLDVVSRNSNLPAVNGILHVIDAVLTGPPKPPSVAPTPGPTPNPASSAPQALLSSFTALLVGAVAWLI